ncbi:MAG: hypothetical protein SOT82_06540 [Oscillospiraceae bacterium]|nr:hypothetical protein [Oscillospiraceae bacterium]
MACLQHARMGFAVVAKFSVNAGEGEYVTEYRVYKGSDWAGCGISHRLRARAH